MKVMIDHVSGSKSGCKESFERESLIIGRGRSNDVSLDPFLDPTVSSHHAEIRLEENGFVLYDMGSLNGTYLNGTGVRRATIQDGDEISLGQQGPRLLFRFSEHGGGKSENGIARAIKQFQPTRGPKTSRETQMPLLDESVVSPNFWVYCAAFVFVIIASILSWKFVG
ncbi:MAG: pSer/pThr/pTyr-binding forkhead associated (FHA) protein [Planctomycetota bacterium]|jgi:pSer/pThr/pTyr-binding forkhead associated (FHA) protein